MPRELKVPGRTAAHWMEWRSGQIPDPVERLRFLRENSGLDQRPQLRLPGWGGGRRVVSAFLWISVLIPAYPPSSRARGIMQAQSATEAAISATLAGRPDVWPVERNLDFDLYSNGLRVEREFSIAGRPRRPFPVFDARSTGTPVAWRSDPAGIVFHSTESHQAAFEASEVRSLKRIGRNLLEYVRSLEAYHFVIDRFGRVYRIVGEGGIANHAGWSVWSDARGTYVNLNSSFLSIAFESETDATQPLSAAQLHSARVLTDMLRARFGIAASNCVTHAQVSVNGGNMRIGYHTDWASGFPFAELGLPDNYAQPVPSILLFGFEYDETFLAAARRPWAGLLAADRLLQERAGADGLTLRQYRQRLRDRYREIVTGARRRPNEEMSDESYQQAR